MKHLQLFVLFLVLHITLMGQDVPVSPTFTGLSSLKGISRPLRDIPPMTAEEWAAIEIKAQQKALNKTLKDRSYPNYDIALPQGPDEVWQNFMGKTSTNSSKAPIANFSGQSSPYYPPDANGTAGPNHYMQTVNTTYAIYNKSGTLVAGPTNMNQLFGSVPGANYNDGDPLIFYDEQADRWLAVEFSVSGSNDYMLMAVSTTNDPTGTWYQYSFDVADMPDYEKVGIWRDGYYMGTNKTSGNDIYVFERSKMLLGQTAQMVGFDNPWRPTTVDGFMCVPPLDNDGDFAPAGSPGLFITINDDAVGGGSDQLWIYELAVNWTSLYNSTFTRVQQVNVAAFDSHFGTNWDNISQPTTQKLDAIPMVIMNVPQYRNFGDYQTIVCCHTVDVDATNHAGVRWYELRKTPPATTWTIRQQGTYAPDAHSRWMGSVMLNGAGEIGLGYSISSTSLYPGIRYTGQSSAAYDNATGTLDITEEVIQTGSYAQSTYNRWGDYAQACVDPTNDKVFWFTTEYIGSGGTRLTKVASFKFDSRPTVKTLTATNVTTVSATLNGKVSPNGLATNYYFQWGISTSYGNTTSTVSAGTGTVFVNVNAGITGLSGGSTYHYRIVAINSDGTTYGQDQQFIPGSAQLTTTAASSITSTSATSGGNISSDGGSSISARGVCWSTTVNPTITDSHTSDGTGTGIFVSSITGLTPNTTYHVRAYAANSYGTFYGDDLTFKTSCEVVSAYPYTEGFENSGLIPSCWSQEQLNNSGVYWNFVTGNGTTHPSSAHSGTYNACLKDYTTASNVTRLISPVLNLNSLLNPQLTFWHTQEASGTRQDVLYIYYKTSASGTWTLITSYTTSVASWTQRTITLPNPSGEYYIAFQGDAKRGYGICVDDVAITGTLKTLSVTPSSRSVGSTAGNTTFSVTSNTDWTASSNQAWCTVTPSGSGNGTITANFTENTTVDPRSATITVTVNGITPVTVTVNQEGVQNKTLNLTVFLEALYNGLGGMNPAQNGTGNQFPWPTVDQISIELHQAATPYTLVGTAYTGSLNPDGTCQVTLPSALSENYYIVIKHRNSIEVWSATPVSFAGTVISFSFSNSAGNTFGSNVSSLQDNLFGLFTGDVNQDGIIDSNDLGDVDNASNAFATGYLPVDVNGDGIVDSNDLGITDNNVAAFISKIA
ncbi:MAG: hypothetical protein FJY10_09305, partial [Bacteroidetes bacterium]|nr:hypothetical protein [Bacteroidota bacterium]